MRTRTQEENANAEEENANDENANAKEENANDENANDENANAKDENANDENANAKENANAGGERERRGGERERGRGRGGSDKKEDVEEHDVHRDDVLLPAPRLSANGGRRQNPWHELKNAVPREVDGPRLRRDGARAALAAPRRGAARLNNHFTEAAQKFGGRNGRARLRGARAPGGLRVPAAHSSGSYTHAASIAMPVQPR